MARLILIAVFLLGTFCAGGLREAGDPCGPESDSRDPGVHLALGRCWEGAGHLDRALSEYRRTVSLSPHEGEARERLALGYLQKGEDLFAAREFLLLLDDEPDNLTALYKLGGIFYRIGKEDLAISSFSRVVEIDPKYSRAYYNLGAIYANRGEKDKAERYFTIYMTQVPDSGEEKGIRSWIHRHDPQGPHRPDGKDSLPLQ